MLQVTLEAYRSNLKVPAPSEFRKDERANKGVEVTGISAGSPSRSVLVLGLQLKSEAFQISLLCFISLPCSSHLGRDGDIQLPGQCAVLLCCFKLHSNGESLVVRHLLPSLE